MTKAGVPDILACVNGCFVGIEVKSSTGKPSELQIYNVKKIIESGGIAVIVSPEQFGELKDLIVALIFKEWIKVDILMMGINAKFF